MATTSRGPAEGLAGIALACVLGVLATGSARAQAGMAVPGGADVAIVLPPLPSPLVARLRGQTSDLGWRVVVLDPPYGARAVTPGSRVREARRQAAAQGARVVIWIDGEPEALGLRLLDVPRGRLLSRTFPHTPQQRSAAFEALALAVRASLQALSEGDALGTVVPPDEDEPDEPLPTSDADPIGETVSEGESVGIVVGPQAGDIPAGDIPADGEPDADDGDTAVDGPAPTAAGPGLGLMAGGLLQIDGLTPAGLIGAFFEPQLRWPSFALGVRLEHTLEGQVRDARTDVGLLRRGLFLIARRPLPVTSDLVISPGLGVGAVQHVRRTRRVAEGLSGTPTAYPVSAALAATVDASIQLASLGTLELSVLLSAGVQWLWAPPVLAYQHRVMAVERRLWSLTPTFGLGLSLR